MLGDRQLGELTRLFRHGSEDASAALSQWMERPSRISVERVEQILLRDATEELGDGEVPICFCAMSLEGPITGELILAFDDASGLALADLLLRHPLGTSRAWGEVEQSAALETANIIGCAYLNALARSLPGAKANSAELLPSPPRFARDFPESLMQFALMNQAMVSDQMFLTRTEFHIEGAPVSCNLLLVPDADCLSKLEEMLSA